MLNEVIEYLNNYFYKYSSGVTQYSFTKDVTFTTNNTLEGDFADTFLVGEYIQLEDTRLNDGIYKIIAIDDTSITIDATLDITIDTEAEISTTMTKLFIPKDLIATIAEIKTYNTNTTDGIASESQGNRSVSYATSTNGSTGWQTAFKTRLNSYKRLKRE